MAGVEPKSDEVHGYAGWLVGGDLREKLVFGISPHAGARTQARILPRLHRESWV